MRLKDIIEFNKKNVLSGKSTRGYGFTYVARRDFEPGEIIMMGFGKVINHQTDHISVQIKKSQHYLPTKWTGRYWNHSCDPNTYMKTRGDGFPNLVCKKNIKKGEEITYAYYMSEYQWSKTADENSVKCACGAKNCKKIILSFSQLPESDKNKIKKEKICSKYLYTTN